MNTVKKTYAAVLDTWAAQQPQKAFLITDKTITYGAMKNKSAAYAQRLRSLSSRQTILIVKKHPEEQATAFLGAEKAGWVPVLGHSDLSIQEAENLARIRRIAWLDGQDLRPVCPNAPVPPKSVCMGVLSSGSTGLPKLMLRTYASWADFFPKQNALFHVDRETIAFGEGSLSFTGNANLLASILYAGATMILEQGLHPRSWLQKLNRYHVTVLYLVPVKLKLLLTACHEIYPAVCTVLAGSQLLEESVIQALKQHFPQSQIILYYGASEVNYVTWITAEKLLQHPGSVGRPCPGVHVEIRSGLIYITTPYHVDGLVQPCTLGDRGYFDKDGYLIFQGRQGDVINKGGLTISCLRIERAIQSVPGVLDAAIVPIEDAERGQDLGVCLVLSPQHTVKNIRQELKKILSAKEMPRKWAVTAALPLGSTGKVDRQKIQKMFSKTPQGGANLFY